MLFKSLAFYIIKKCTMFKTETSLYVNQLNFFEKFYLSKIDSLFTQYILITIFPSTCSSSYPSPFSNRYIPFLLFTRKENVSKR